MRSLLCRSPLLPGESLPSLLVRLAKLNRYDPIGIINRLCLEGLEKDRLDQPARAATYERMAALTKIAPCELYTATAHRFAPTLTPPGVETELLKLSSGKVVPLLAQGIGSKQLRPPLAAQFCPNCLKEALYHRLVWLSVAASACLQHKCLLMNLCPRCRKAISIRSVVEGQCQYCDAALAQAESIHVEHDLLGLSSQEAIQVWLVSNSERDAHCPYPLPDQPPAVLYRVVDGLRSVVALMGSDWRYAHRFIDDQRLSPFQRVAAKPTPDQSYRLYATAFKSITEWPKHFYEFLREYSLRDGRKGRSESLNRDFGCLYRTWLQRNWQHPAFGFVQEAFDQYLVDEYILSPSTIKSDHHQTSPTLSDKSGYFTHIEAARLLHVSPETIKRLIEIGWLADYRPKEGLSRRYRFVRRDEVLGLRRGWSDLASLEETAHWLGVSKDVALDMVRLGLLAAERGPDVRGGNQWMFSKQAIAQCLEKVKDHLGRSPITCDRVVNLATAERMLSIVGLGAAGILKRVVDGKLYGHCPRKSVSGLGSVVFAEFDIRRTIEKVKMEKGWMT